MTDVISPKVTHGGERLDLILDGLGRAALDAELYGVVADGEAKDAEFADALAAMLSQRKTLMVPANVRLAETATLALDAGAFVSLECKARGGKFLPHDDHAGTHMLSFTRAMEVGGLSQSFPTNDGHTFATENPTSALSVAAAKGAFRVTVANPEDWLVGDLVSLKAHRLTEGESRNYTMRSAIHRIREIDGDDLVLDGALEWDFAASALLLSAVAVSSGTSNTIVLATPPGDPDALVGCRVRIVGGTGSGQTRYITRVDGATLYIDTSTDWAQSAWSPTANGTSTVTVDAPTYLYRTRPADLIRIAGFDFDASDNAAVTHIGTLRGAARIELTGVTCRGATKQGFSIRDTVDPEIVDNVVIDASDETLGYGYVVDNVRAPWFSGLLAQNCRRPVDTAGDRDCWHGVVRDMQVFGGELTAQGDPWIEDYNYAAGAHGQAKEWSWDVECWNVGVPALSRGAGEYQRVRIHGAIRRGVWDFRAPRYIAHVEVADLEPRGLTQEDIDGGEGALVYVTPQTGVAMDATVTLGPVRGLEGHLTFGATNSGLATTARMPTRATVLGATVEWRTDLEVALIAALDGSFIAAGWMVAIDRALWNGERPYYSNAQRGGFGAFTSAAAAGASLTYQESATRWYVSIRPGDAVSIPSRLTQNQVGVSLGPREDSNTLDRLFRGRLKTNSTKAVVTSAISGVTIADPSADAFDMPLTTTAGADLLLGHDGTHLWLGDPSTVQLDLVVELDSLVF